MRTTTAILILSAVHCFGQDFTGRQLTSTPTKFVMSDLVFTNSESFQYFEAAPIYTNISIPEIARRVAHEEIANLIARGEIVVAPAENFYGGYELTIGMDGVVSPKAGKSEVALDFSLSTNPFKQLHNLWIGIEQAVAWEPHFAGSTDLSVEWAFNLYKETLYLNVGWSVGASYDGISELIFQTGPQATLQYYTSDSAFVFVGANWDVTANGQNELPYYAGVGICF